MALKTNSYSALPFVLKGVGAGRAEEREAGKLQPGYCTYLGLDVATMCSAENGSRSVGSLPSYRG